MVSKFYMEFTCINHITSHTNHLTNSMGRFFNVVFSGAVTLSYYALKQFDIVLIVYCYSNKIYLKRFIVKHLHLSVEKNLKIILYHIYHIL